MKIKLSLALGLLISATFADYTGTVGKVFYADSNVPNVTSAIYFEVKTGSGSPLFWIGHEDKDALSIVLTAKSTGGTVSVKPTTDNGNRISYGPTIVNRAAQIIMD